MSDRSRDTCENYESPKRFTYSATSYHFRDTLLGNTLPTVYSILDIANALHNEVVALRKRIKVLEGHRKLLAHEIAQSNQG